MYRMFWKMRLIVFDNYDSLINSAKNMDQITTIEMLKYVCSTSGAKMNSQYTQLRTKYCLYLLIFPFKILDIW